MPNRDMYGRECMYYGDLARGGGPTKPDVGEVNPVGVAFVGLTDEGELFDTDAARTIELGPALPSYCECGHCVL